MSRTGLQRVLGSAVMGVAALLVLACASNPPPGGIVVERRPPPDRVEVIGVAPGRGYLWIRGFWRWERADYVWVPGRWAGAERGHRRWASGHWAHTRRGWYWVEGRWR